MGYGLQVQDLSQVAPLGDPFHQAAVVELEKLPEDQQGEELRLRKLVLALGVTVGRQSLLADLQGQTGQGDRIPGGVGHVGYIGS